jgi:hypothetical protein
MLTEIEWWGGLLFVVGAVVYRMTIGALDKDTGFDANRLISHLFFLAPAVVLAGYFYPLDRPALRYGYLAALAVALLAVAAIMAMEVWDHLAAAKSDDAANAGAPERAAQPAHDALETRMQGVASADDGGSEESEEPVGTLYTLLGMVFMYSPVLIVCALGCYKAWPMVQSLFHLY